MLLVIATAHAHLFRFAADGRAAFTLDGPLDAAITAAMELFAENRGYPMFATLFGYGLARVHLLRAAGGRGSPRRHRAVRVLAAPGARPLRRARLRGTDRADRRQAGRAPSSPT
jgi:uncharacterized membrane protein YeiB